MSPVPRPTVAQITSLGSPIQAETCNSGRKTAPVTLETCAQNVLGSGAVIHAAYLHVPFCFHKCHYCDFYSIVDSRDRQSDFVRRLIEEIKICSRLLQRPLESLFVGGGTPTLLKPELWRDLLIAMSDFLPLAEGGEFTVEANPETVTPELIDVLVNGGVNRISIGCQSFHPKHLKTLERWHEPVNVLRTVDVLRRHGIDNFNLDLIFAIPGQTLEDWFDDLEQALALRPAHLSCYGLVYEPNTPLTLKMRSGRIQACDQELEAAMYAGTRERLAAAGYEHYEISNWASTSNVKSNCRCRHNMTYWKNCNWLAFGPSASGHINGLRWKNVPRLGEYLEHGPWPRIVDVEVVDDETRIGEEFMLGLRLIEGMPISKVEHLLSIGTRGEQRRRAIELHRRQGLLDRSDSSLRLTERGLMLADSVIGDLL